MRIAFNPRFIPGFRHLRLDNGPLLIGIAAVVAVVEAAFLFSLFLPAAPSTAVAQTDAPVRVISAAPGAEVDGKRPSHGARTTDLNTPPEQGGAVVRAGGRDLKVAAPAKRDSFNDRFWPGPITTATIKPSTTGTAPKPPVAVTAPKAPEFVAASKPTEVVTAPKPPVAVTAPKPPVAVAAKPPEVVAAPKAPEPKPTEVVAAPKPPEPVAAPKPTEVVAAPKAPEAAPAPETRTVVARPAREIRRPAATPAPTRTAGAREIRSDIVRSPDGRQWKRTTYTAPTAGGGTKTFQITRPLQQSPALWGTFARGF